MCSVCAIDTACSSIRTLRMKAYSLIWYLLRLYQSNKRSLSLPASPEYVVEHCTRPHPFCTCTVIAPYPHMRLRASVAISPNESSNAVARATSLNLPLVLEARTARKLMRCRTPCITSRVTLHSIGILHHRISRRRTYPAGYAPDSQNLRL
jgi:hypothetical protein